MRCAGKPVNQVLGSELPATPLPVPYPEGDSRASDADDDVPATGSGTSVAIVRVALGVVLSGCRPSPLGSPRSSR